MNGRTVGTSELSISGGPLLRGVCIGISKYTHPGCLFPHKNSHADAPGCQFTVNMGILLLK